MGGLGFNRAKRSRGRMSCGVRGRRRLLCVISVAVYGTTARYDLGEIFRGTERTKEPISTSRVSVSIIAVRTTVKN